MSHRHNVIGLTDFKTRSSKLARLSTTLLFVAAYGIAVYALWIGIDFGKHWDEKERYDDIIQMYRSSLLLPRYYQYPSMIFWLGLASVSDRLLAILYSGVKPELPFDFAFFILRARTLTMLLSSLGAWWVFLALRCSDLARPALGAALGGSIYALSWEFGYHARWFAPDLVTAQFVALFVFFIAKAEREKEENSHFWLTAAALAAGLATATKYTAAGLVPTLWLYSFLRRGPRRATLATITRQTAIAVGIYLLITPATLLDPVYFARDVLFQMHHYATGHSSNYGVAEYDIHGFWRYLSRLWEYLCLAMLSPQPVIAAALATTSILGLISMWRRSKPLAAALGFLIVFYSIFFSLQVVFIVRNFLIFFLPVFAYLAGVGFDALINPTVKMPAGWPRPAAILTTGMLLTIALGWNAWQQLAFGWSIVDAQRQPLVHQVAEYLAHNTSTRVALSPSLAADLVATGEPLPANVTNPSGAVSFIFRTSDLAPSAHLSSWPATQHDTFDWIGPREVNLNYYPNWKGADHAFILSMNAAERMGVISALFHAPHS